MAAQRIFGLILAGGRSRRMGGGDKAFVLLAGRPMLAHVAERFVPQVEAGAISANGAPDRYAVHGMPVIADAGHCDAGPLAGIAAGLAWARANAASHLATVATDTPLLPLDLVSRLAEAGNGGISVAGSQGRLHPVAALWPIAILPAIEAFLEGGSRRMTDFLDGHKWQAVDFGRDGPDPFFNVNTPEDLAAAERMMTEGQ